MSSSSSWKKKSVTTMTLKDFHGGTIPTDLPLPSAPGVSAPSRPTPPPPPPPQQPDHHRQVVPTRRPHHQVVPPPPPRGIPIGRHFDEDERTPFTLTSPPPVTSRSDNLRPVNNAWAPRSRDSANTVGPTAAQQGPTVWSATRIAQASAVEKVISGKWHSKAQAQAVVGLTTPQQVEVEVERPRSEVGGRGGGDHQSAVARPASHEGRIGVGADVITERPKLKLLPRSNHPLETAQPDVFEEKQVHKPSINFLPAENVPDTHENVSTAKTIMTVTDGESRAGERPRLNLKPRSTPVGQSGETAAKERKTVFGGARPRELVLKERGIDVVASDLENTSPASRATNDLPKTESKPECAPVNSSGERSESFQAGQRSYRNGDRKDYRRDVDKVDTHRPSRRDDNRRMSRDVEKQPEQPCPEPETWRKPVVQPKADVPAPRLGKTATALELAQAFSKPVSDTVPQSRLTTVPNQRVNQAGFSRLTGNGAFHSGPAQRRINGY